MTRLKEVLATPDAQPAETRDLFLPRFVEVWLAQLRADYEIRHHGGDDG